MVDKDQNQDQWSSLCPKASAWPSLFLWWVWQQWFNCRSSCCWRPDREIILIFNLDLGSFLAMWPAKMWRGRSLNVCVCMCSFFWDWCGWRAAVPRTVDPPPTEQLPTRSSTTFQSCKHPPWLPGNWCESLSQKLIPGQQLINTPSRFDFSHLPAATKYQAGYPTTSGQLCACPATWSTWWPNPSTCRSGCCSRIVIRRECAGVPTSWLSAAPVSASADQPEARSHKVQNTS